MKNKQKPKIVVIGGGTGSFVILSGLKKYPPELTAVVAVTDDGGSTGRLRDEFGFLPVGDMRQCIAALSENSLLKDILLYRFEKGKGLKGHNFGNLLLTVLEDTAGSESRALEVASRIFRIKGQILPVSLKLVKLAAKYKSNKTILSEHKIEINSLKKGDKIVKLYTIPKASINPKSAEAIKKANLIVLGPGDLFGSTIANLIIKGVPNAIRQSKAQVVLIINLMTIKSQTHGFTALDHLKELEKYLGKKVDYIIINDKKIPDKIEKSYKKLDEYPVVDDLAKDKRVTRGDFLASRYFKKSKADSLRRSLLRHDSGKLASCIVSLLK